MRVIIAKIFVGLVLVSFATLVHGEVVQEETWYNADGKVVKTVKRTMTGADARKTDCSPGATACGACMSGYTADSSGVCKKDATPEPAAPSPSDDHHGHDHGSPSAADVSSATTMSPASMLTALAMLVAYVMH